MLDAALAQANTDTHKKDNLRKITADACESISWTVVAKNYSNAVKVIKANNGGNTESNGSNGQAWKA